MFYMMVKHLSEAYKSIYQRKDLVAPKKDPEGMTGKMNPQGEPKAAQGGDHANAPESMIRGRFRAAYEEYKDELRQHHAEKFTKWINTLSEGGYDITKWEKEELIETYIKENNLWESSEIITEAILNLEEHHEKDENGKVIEHEIEDIKEYVDFLIAEGYDCSELTWDDMSEEYASLDEGLRSAMKRLLGKKEESPKPMSRGEQLRKKYNVGPEKSDTSAKALILKKTRAKKEADQKQYGGSTYSKSVAKKSADTHDRYLRSGYSKYGAGDARGKGNKARKRAEALKKEEVSDWRKEVLSEEEYDHWRDKQLEKYGSGWRGHGRRSSTARSGGTQPKPMPKKGKTVMQKETEKKYGKGKSALDIVKADIIAKHGKGAIMDTKKKKD